MKKLFLVTIAAALMMLMTATAAFAQATGAANQNNTTATLLVNATIQDAGLLTLSTGTTPALTHCAISNTGSPNYTMNFGTVDALGVNNGNCNKYAPVNPGQNQAVYYTDYTITPAWAGLTATNAASVTAWALALETGVSVAVPSTSPDVTSNAGLTAATWTNIGTAIGSATPVMSGTALSAAGADGTAATRLLGLTILPTATAASGGTAVNTTVTFTMTIK